MGDLLTLLKSPDNANHRLAVAMTANFSNEDWKKAVQEIAYFIADEKNEGVKHFSPTFKTLNNIWYIQIYHVNKKLQPYLIYDGFEKMCILRDDFRFKYNGKENFAKVKQRLFAAILEYEQDE